MRSRLTILMLALLLAHPARGAEPAPPLEGTLMNGKPFHLAEHKGHAVLVHFWATWCAPCRKEMAALEAYATKHPDTDIIAISMDDDAEKARDFMKAYSFPGALYDEMEADGYGRITHLPQTIVINRDGSLGETLEDMAALEKLKL